MSKQPLKSTDKRRGFARPSASGSNPKDTNGAGPPLADLFSDRRKNTGKGKRLF